MLKEKLKAERKRVGLTQHQLSQKSGVSRVTIARIESTNTDASLQTVCKLASALDISVDDLLYKRTPISSAV